MKGLLLFALCIIPLVGFAQESRRNIELEHIHKDHFIYPTEEADVLKFSAKGDYFFRIENNVLKRIALANHKEVTVVLDANQLITEDGQKLSLEGAQMDNSENRIMFLHHRRTNIYRWSFMSVVYFYDMEKQQLYKLNDQPIMYPSFSPDGKKVAYVLQRNLWVYDIATQKSSQLTFDGKDNELANGMADWVYEEEFELTKAYEWMLDNQHIVYLSMNEKRVPSFHLQYNLTVGSYPGMHSFKYPKVGENNSLLSLNVVDIHSRVNRSLSVLSHSGKTETDIYIPRIYVTPDNNVCALRLNRLQNKMELLLFEGNKAEPRAIYQEEDKYYIDLSHFYIKFISNGDKVLLTSERDGFQQLFLQNIKTGKLLNLTPKAVDIDEVVGLDEINSSIYYTLAFPSRLDRNLYKTDFSKAQPITVPITTGEGWNTFQFNPSTSFYLHTYAHLLTPPITRLVETATNKSIVMADNAALKSVLKQYGFRFPSYVPVTNRSGEKLLVRMLTPEGFDTSGRTTYPVLFFNYGGPGSQQVTHQFANSMYAWLQMLTQRGYIILTCDNTGTGFNGAVFKKKTYKQLGSLEIADQIDVAKYFAKKPYVDASRIGHIGWSFGGFMSALAITKGAEVFSAAVAIAPVTHWKFYDNAYTERFMQRLSDNPAGYEQTSPINYVEHMKGKFLIIHGSADDNVHPQNTYQMVEEMVQQNKKFDMYIYPDKSHSIRGGNTTFHLWSTVTEWLWKNL